MIKIKELSLNILDIVENSTKAGASFTEILIDECDELITIVISDNGCGMDENTLKRMFEPFFTTKPVGQGTGMGMAMAYGTVKNHRGSIGVKSQLDKGTEIFIVLPPLVE